MLPHPTPAERYAPPEAKPEFVNRLFDRGAKHYGLDLPRISLEEAPDCALNNRSGLGGGNVGDLLRCPL